LGERVNKVWSYLILFTVILTTYLIYAGYSFLWIALPSHTLAGVVAIFAGIAFYKNRDLSSKSLFLLFVIWGLHRLNYPFLRNVEWFAAIGFEIARIITFLISFAILYSFLKLIEGERNQETRKYETIFEYSPDAKFLLDFNSADILDTNYRACELLGYSKEEIKSRKPWDIAVGIDENFIEMERKILEKEKFFNMESMVRKKDGKLLPVNVRIVKLDKEKVVVNMRDISKEKEALKAIEESEKRFRALFDNMTEAFLFCEWDLAKTDAIIQDVSKSFENMFNIKKDAVKGKKFSELIEKLNFIDLGEIKKYEEPISYCCMNEVDDKYYRLNIIPIGNEEFVINVLDITALAKAEKEKMLMEKKMIQAQKMESLSVLAGGIAHDFNNILTGILGNTQLALMRLDPGSKVSENIKAIEKATLLAAELTKQMLAYSGKGKFFVEPINLNILIEEMKPIILTSISKKVTLNLILSKEDLFIEGDRSQISQIVINLTINASEAIDNKEGVINIVTGKQYCDKKYLSKTYTTDTIPEGDYAYIEVIDTGKGIPKEMFDKIFDPFFSTKFIGRGLGLAAVLGIVRGHKGTINIYSELNKGTTFKILLPLKKEFELKNKKTLDPVFNYKDLTILFIDDDEIVRDYAKKLFNHLKVNNMIASNGIEGVEILKNNKNLIDIVFLDLTMPKMGGEETFREIKKIRQNIPVVLISGYNCDELSQRFASKGFAAFMQKPIKINDVIGVIDNILKEKK